MPTIPIPLSDDSWMDEPLARARFEQELARLDELWKPFTNALEDSERLTEKDLGLVINC